MPGTRDQPAIVRATAFIGVSRWLRRPVRRVRYDACRADGRVDFDVSLTDVMYRGWRPDFAAIDNSVHAHCPRIGTGQWVNDVGQVVEGPAQVDPHPPGRSGGRPRRYRPDRRQPHPQERRAWRRGAGVTGLRVGILRGWHRSRA